MLLLLYTLLILLVPVALVIVAMKYMDLGKAISGNQAPKGLLFKSPAADLRTYRFLFLSLGLLLAVGLSSFVLNWEFEKGTKVEELLVEAEGEEKDIYEKVIVPVQALPEPPPPPELDQVEEVEPEEVIEKEITPPEEEQTDPVIDFSDIDAMLTDSSATEAKIGPIDNNIYDFVEQDAGFPGGDAAMLDYVKVYVTNKLKRYNKKLLREGVVNVTFVVEKDGTVSDVKILGPGIPNKYQNDAAVEAVEKMPNWSPAKNNGFEVRQRFRIPVKF